MSFWTDGFWSDSFWSNNFWSGPTVIDPIPLCGQAVGSIVESFDVTTNQYGMAAANYRYGMRWATNPFETIYGACFRLSRLGTPTGSMKLVVHSMDGANDQYDDPADNESPAYDISGVVTDPEGAFYWIPLLVDVSEINDLFIAFQVEDASGIDESNYISIVGVTADSYPNADGLLAQLPATTVGGSVDLAFKVYGTSDYGLTNVLGITDIVSLN